MNFRYIVFILIFSFSCSHGMDSDDNGADASAAAAAAESCVFDGKQEADEVFPYWKELPFGTKQRIVEYATGGEGRSSAEFLMLQEVAIPNRELEEGRGNIRDVAFSPDGKKLASGSLEKTHVWDVQSGQEICNFDISSDGGVAFSPVGNQLALGSNDGAIYVCDLEAKKIVRRLEGHTDFVRSIAYSPDGTLIVSVSNDDTARLWDTSLGREIKIFGHSYIPHKIVFSPNGECVAVGGECGELRMWYMPNGEPKDWDLGGGIIRGELNMMNLDGIGSIGGISFSPDGNFFALGTSTSDADSRKYTPQVSLWNYQTGKLEHRLEHQDSVYSVSHSSDGELLASQSGDGTVRLWDLLTKKEIRALHGGQHGMAAPQDVRSVTFSPDDNQLACGVDVAKLRDLTTFNIIRKWFKDGCPLTKDRFEFSRQDDAGAVSQKYSKPVDPMRVRLLMEKLASAYQMMRQAPDTEKETHVVKLTIDEMADWGCLPEVVQHVLIRVVKQVPVVAKKPERKCSIM